MNYFPDSSFTYRVLQTTYFNPEEENSKETDTRREQEIEKRPEMPKEFVSILNDYDIMRAQEPLYEIKQPILNYYANKRAQEINESFVISEELSHRFKSKKDRRFVPNP